MASKREAAITGLYNILQPIDGPTVFKNDYELREVPTKGAIIVGDGSPGEPEVTLSPPAYYWTHAAELFVEVQGGTAAERDSLTDDILSKIDALIEADRTLGDTVDIANIVLVEFLDEPVIGGNDYKSARVVVDMEYETTTPLG